jgi:ketosteroid isomerase-like protein
MNDTREDRNALFSKLQSPETQPQFWARVADDVDWTVEGTHPLAGRYHNKQEFIDATFGRLAGVLVGGVKLEVQHLFIDGETTIVELRSTSTTIEGAAFANTYCWVCRFDGDTIVQVRAYLDSTMVAYTILRNERK